MIPYKVIESFSREDTFSFAKKIGEEAYGGEVLALYGDLGVGKTVFAKGLAEGLSIKEDINSPTFTIIQEYDSGRIPFYHFDVYRIMSEDEMEETGFFEKVYDKEGVALIEWAEKIEDMLPDNTKKIVIEKDNEKGFDYRRITITSLKN